MKFGEDLMEVHTRTIWEIFLTHPVYTHCIYICLYKKGTIFPNVKAVTNFDMLDCCSGILHK